MFEGSKQFIWKVNELVRHRLDLYLSLEDIKGRTWRVGVDDTRADGTVSSDESLERQEHCKIFKDGLKFASKGGDVLGDEIE